VNTQATTQANTQTNSHDFDVLVVGGGPSGLVTAAEAARAGASVAILEARTGDPMSRAGTLLPRPLELFDARGIADRFVRRTCEVNPHPFTTEHIWAGLHPVNWDSLDSRFGFTLYLAQSETESLLREWATESGVKLLMGHQVLDVDTSHDDHVAVQAQREDGTTVTHTAGYVVGADGARGVVRRSVGIELEGRDATFTGVAAVLDMPFPWEGGYRSVTNEHGWLLSFPFGPGRTRMGIVHAEGRKLGRDVPVTKEEIEKYASEITGEPITIPGVIETNRYGNARKMAVQFRKDRVFLVGEALRHHYPASGVGMNFCIQDAFNLGWKLGAVVAGKADEALLDTFETERRPVCLRLLDSVDAQVSIQFDFSPEAQTFLSRFQDNLISLPDVTRQLQAELQGLEAPYELGRDVFDTNDAVGWHVPDFEVIQHDGTTARVYELLRRDGVLVLELGGTRILAEAGLESENAHVVAGHAVRRPDRIGDSTVLVIRPDAYIAHAAAGMPDPEVTRAAVRQAYGFPAKLNP
jgi:2-polyprenyl-6-methoxyphenol hydroxylase-like FAD-dependent oxidoreductase